MLLAMLILPACVSSALEPAQFRAVGAPVSTTQNVTATETALATDSATIEPGPIALVPVDATEVFAVSGATSAQDQSSNGEPSEADRQRGVAEIRNKAAMMPNEKPQVGLLPESAAQPMTAEQQAKNAAELEAALAENAIADEEIDAKTASILLLKRKAKTHYSDAVSGIAK